MLLVVTDSGRCSLGHRKVGGSRKKRDSKACLDLLPIIENGHFKQVLSRKLHAAIAAHEECVGLGVRDRLLTYIVVGTTL
jgi:hypothetical protein